MDMVRRKAGHRRTPSEGSRRRSSRAQFTGEDASSDQGLDEFICDVRGEVRALVGGHFYFIQVREEITLLCRVPHLAGDRPVREVLDHRQHGITDDDLEHAIRMKAGHGAGPGYYEISDHIERKLRALLDA